LSNLKQFYNNPKLDLFNKFDHLIVQYYKYYLQSTEKRENMKQKSFKDLQWVPTKIGFWAINEE
jgi:hypothetical protein